MIFQLRRRERIVRSMHAIDRLFAPRAHLAPVVLRLGLGTVFLAHAYAKLFVFTLPGTVAFFEANGLPGWTAYAVLALELVGGLALVAGLQVRLVATLLVPVMLGALVPHAGHGWMFTNAGGGWEYVAFLLVALVTQALLGGGRASAPTGAHVLLALGAASCAGAVGAPSPSVAECSPEVGGPTDPGAHEQRRRDIDCRTTDDAR